MLLVVSYITKESKCLVPEVAPASQVVAGDSGYDILDSMARWMFAMFDKQMPS